MILTLPHHLDDYECMWNGIEDLYQRDTGATLPPQCFFSLASFGSFAYLHTDKAPLKRMVALGDGRTKQMYEFLAPIVGFTYRHTVHTRFERALQKAKSEIDAGFPAVLGALDMYHLSYLPKLYHAAHIPFHYVLMVGYDDAASCIWLYDCGRADLQRLSYEDLRLAWDCECPGLSKPNTVCTVRMGPLQDPLTIARSALRMKSKQFLHPQTGFLGLRGMRKFLCEFPNWAQEMSKADVDAIWIHMVTFWGDVPTLPNALQGIQAPDSMAFEAGFGKMRRVLMLLGTQAGEEKWIEACEDLGRGGAKITEIKEILVSALTGEADERDELPFLFAEVLDALTRAMEKVG